MTKITVAVLSRSASGTFVELTERPLHALLADELGEALTEVTVHLLCCKIPDWTAKIRWGREDEDGYTDRSLYHQLYRFGSWAQLGFGTWRKERLIAMFPVSDEWVQEHYPDAGWPFDGSSGDGMDSEPGDSGDLVL